MNSNRKYLTIMLGLVLLAGVAIAATWGTGLGGFETADTDAQKVTLGTTVNTLSVKNTGSAAGSNTVFVLVNCATNTLNTRVAAGTAVPILAGDAYTFNAQGNASVESFCFKCTNGTSDITYGGY